jgi:hypothetical protein
LGGCVSRRKSTIAVVGGQHGAQGRDLIWGQGRGHASPAGSSTSTSRDGARSSECVAEDCGIFSASPSGPRRSSLPSALSSWLLFLLSLQPTFWRPVATQHPRCDRHRVRHGHCRARRLPPRRLRSSASPQPPLVASLRRGTTRFVVARTTHGHQMHFLKSATTSIVTPNSYKPAYLCSLSSRRAVTRRPTCFHQCLMQMM